MKLKCGQLVTVWVDDLDPINKKKYQGRYGVIDQSEKESEMNDLKPIDRRHAAYNKAYQDAIREGAKSVSDLDIVIREKMGDMGFYIPERESPEHD